MPTSRPARLVLAACCVGLVVATSAVFVHAVGDEPPGAIDTTFVPISPCRLTDTRPAPDRIGPHSTFSSNDTRKITTRQNAGNCTIPSAATGLSLNVTAVNTQMATHLTIWPGGPVPNASSLNPAPGTVAFNAVNTPLASDGSFAVRNFRGTVDVIIDVNGYYTKSSLVGIADSLDAGSDWIDYIANALPFARSTRPRRASP